MRPLPFIWFYLGTALLAIVIGGLIGVSSSPVVAVAVPLLFALLTAGGALYVVLGKEEPSEGKEATLLSNRDRRYRASFLGKQLTAFALGIIPGVWLGVWAKTHSETLWGYPAEARPAFAMLAFSDMREMATSMVLDQHLIASRVPLAERERLFLTLHAAMLKRATSDQALSPSDATSAEMLLRYYRQETKEAKSADAAAGDLKVEATGVATMDTSSLPADIRDLMHPDKPIG